MPDDSISFHEEQKFRQPWLIGLVGVSTLATIGMLLNGLNQQLILHKPWGNRPMSDGAFIVFAFCMITLMLGIFLLLVQAKLTTEVRGDGVYIKFFPFHRRFHWFQFKDIAKAEPVTYNPLRDYGGWGIRYGAKGKAYNVSGDRGVMLTFWNNTTLMIGSQEANELADAVKKRVGGLS